MKADHDFTARIFLCRWLVAALVLCFPLISQAAKWDRSTDYYWNVGNGNITAFPGQGTGNIWSSGSKVPASGGPQWTGAAKQLPFNPSPTANFKAKFTPTAMAKALTNPTLLIPFFAADILNTLLSEACVRVAGGTMELAPGGQWEECNMVSGTITQYSTYAVPEESQWHNSKESAWADFAARNPPGWCRDYRNIDHNWSASETRYQIWDTCNNWSVQWAIQSYVTRTGTTSTQDGWKPSTAASAEEKILPKLTAWSQADFLYGFDSSSGKPSGGTGAVLDKIINSGAQIDAEIVAPTVQTPINEAPVTTTTTNPDGSTKTETEVTTNDYSCLVIQNGAAVECKQYKTTTKTTATTSNPNGTGTVTTTATSVTTQETKPGDEVDQCAKYPDSLGCSKLTIEVGDAIPRVTKTLTYAAETVLGGGSCPSDKFMNIGGQQVKVWNWVQACDYITTYVRPLVLAVAAFVALIIVMPGGAAARGFD